MNDLTNLSVWDKLTAAQQDELLKSSTTRAFQKGGVVHGGAHRCMGLILVVSGQLRAYTVSDDGREITLYRLFERDICLFSASCMMNSIQFEITVAAEKDTLAVIVPTDVYKRIMEVSAPLANFTNEVMASRFSEVMWLIEQIMWKSFDKRLAEFLLNETSIEGTTVLHMTHEVIGNHLGHPREVVTRMLKYFVGEGLVRLARGTVEITDAKRLKGIAMV